MFHIKSLSLFSRMNCSGAPSPLQLASRVVGLRVVVFIPAASVPSGTLLKMQIPSLSPHKCICGDCSGKSPPAYQTCPASERDTVKPDKCSPSHSDIEVGVPIPQEFLFVFKDSVKELTCFGGLFFFSILHYSFNIIFI